LHDGTNVAILLEYADPTEDPDDSAAVETGGAGAAAFSSAETGCTIRNPMASHTPTTTFGTIWLSPRIISSVLSLLTPQRVALCAFLSISSGMGPD